MPRLHVGAGWNLGARFDRTIADLVVCDPRQLALRDLPEMFLIRGIVFSHEAVRD